MIWIWSCPVTWGVVRKVEAAGVAVLSDRIDIANARIEFSDGCVANFTASRVSTGRLRKLRVFQPNAYLSVDYQARQAVIHQRLYKNSNGRKFYFQTKHLEGNNEEPLHRELTSFVGAVQNGSHPLVSGKDGLMALKLAHQILGAIRRSSSFSKNSRKSSFRLPNSK